MKTAAIFIIIIRAVFSHKMMEICMYYCSKKLEIMLLKYVLEKFIYFILR